MELLRMWRESFLTFKPENFKQFAGAIALAVKQTFTTWICYWWWFAAAAFLGMYVVSAGFFNVTFGWELAFLGSFLFSVFSVFSLVASARPSVAKKDWDYFSGLLWSVPYLVLFVILIALISLIVLYFFIYTFDVQSLKMQIPFDARVVIVFFLLFFLDSNRGIKEFFKSSVRAFKMFVYNLPTIIASQFFLYGISLLVNVIPLLPSLALYKQVLWSFVSLLMIVSITVTVYTIEINKHKKIYLPEKFL